MLLLSESGEMILFHTIYQNLLCNIHCVAMEMYPDEPATQQNHKIVLFFTAACRRKYHDSSHKLKK